LTFQILKWNNDAHTHLLSFLFLTGRDINSQHATDSSTYLVFTHH